METNFEHYKDELLIEILCNSSSTCDFIRKHILNTDDCRTISCEDCKQRVKEWLEKEYQPEEYHPEKYQPEPKIEINWTKVPKDTLVYVTDFLNDDGTLRNKRVRHFCKYEHKYKNDRFFTYNDGFSSNETISKLSWKYCELAVPEDIEKYKK